MVPDLDFQLFRQASAAFPDMSWEAWADHAHMAASDSTLRRDIAKGIELSLVGHVRRTLNFDNE